MSASYTYRDRARRDVADIASYLDEKAGPEVSDRFIRAVEDDGALLASMPYLGSIVEDVSPRLEGLRFWLIRRFPNYLIYYRPTGQGVELCRVVHGAQDLGTVIREAL